MYLTINLACVLNWHLRILAIRPVPGGWCGPVPLRSRSGSYCRLPHQVGLEAFAFAFGILHVHVLNLYVRICTSIYMLVIMYYLILSCSSSMGPYSKATWPIPMS